MGACGARRRTRRASRWSSPEHTVLALDGDERDLLSSEEDDETRSECRRHDWTSPQADTGKDSHLSAPIIPDSHRDLLQSTALAYLATIGPKGEPQVSAVWFTWDGAHLLFAFNKKRQKYRNVLREPRVAIALTDPGNPYRALEIRGVVARIDEDCDFRFINAASQKYLGRDATAEETGLADERVMIVVEPERAITFPSQAGNKSA
jgi:PPOX class probable F420-dependent enzyme